MHQERAYSKALAKENHDLKLKSKEFENKGPDDLLIRTEGQGAEWDFHGESQTNTEDMMMFGKLTLEGEKEQQPDIQYFNANNK